MVGRLHVPVFDAFFVPLISEIIMTWGALDEAMDQVSEAMSIQPECVGIEKPKSSSFRKRLAYFNLLARSYFASAPSMVKFSDRFYNAILKIQSDRDLVAHGRYGWAFSNEGTALRLTELKGEQFIGKIYTREEFKEVSEKIGNYLYVLHLHRSDVEFSRIPNFLQEQ